MTREKSIKNAHVYIVHLQQLPAQGQFCFVHTHTSLWIILGHNHITSFHS